MSDLFVERKSGLLIPKGTPIKKANEEIANDYKEEATSHAADLLRVMRAEEVASFLWTKSRSVDLIAGAE